MGKKEREKKEWQNREIHEGMDSMWILWLLTQVRKEKE